MVGKFLHYDSKRACQALKLPVEFALRNQASCSPVLVPCDPGYALHSIF